MRRAFEFMHFDLCSWVYWKGLYSSMCIIFERSVFKKGTFEKGVFERGVFEKEALLKYIY